MDTTETEPPPLLLDEHDAAAVSALLIRMVRLDDELTRDREIVNEVNARIAAGTVLRAKTLSAFTVFGFETGDGLWGRVRQSIGSQGYDRAVAIARNKDAPLLEAIRDDGDEPEVSVEDDPNDRATRHVPRTKDAILEYLQGVGDTGGGVREIRRYLADAHGITVHEKTPGMTLYRLLKDGFVTRQGRIWFVAKTPETKGGKDDALADLNAFLTEPTKDRGQEYEEHGASP